MKDWFCDTHDPLHFAMADAGESFITLRELSKVAPKQYTRVTLKRSFMTKYDEYFGGQESAFAHDTFYYIGDVFWHGGCFKLELNLKKNRPHLLVPSTSQEKHPCPAMLDEPCIMIHTT